MPINKNYGSVRGIIIFFNDFEKKKDCQVDSQDRSKPAVQVFDFTKLGEVWQTSQTLTIKDQEGIFPHKNLQEVLLHPDKLVVILFFTHRLWFMPTNR